MCVFLLLFFLKEIEQNILFSIVLSLLLVFPSRVDAMHGLYLEKANGNCGCAVECQEAKILAAVFFFFFPPSIRCYFRHHFFLLLLFSRQSMSMYILRYICSVDVLYNVCSFISPSIISLFAIYVYILCPVNSIVEHREEKIEKHIKLIIHCRRTHLVSSSALIITETSKFSLHGK